jgi:hypothetical protein
MLLCNYMAMGACALGDACTEDPYVDFGVSIGLVLFGAAPLVHIVAWHIRGHKRFNNARQEQSKIYKEETSRRLDTLCERFPHIDRSTTEKCLLECDGHAGKAASLLHNMSTNNLMDATNADAGDLATSESVSAGVGEDDSQERSGAATSPKTDAPPDNVVTTWRSLMNKSNRRRATLVLASLQPATTSSVPVSTNNPMHATTVTKDVFSQPGDTALTAPPRHTNRHGRRGLHTKTNALLMLNPMHDMPELESTSD